MKFMTTFWKSTLLVMMALGVSSLAMAQKTYLKNAVYLNSGVFGGSPTASIGGYDPLQESYEHFDSIYVGSVQDIAIDSVNGDRAYLAAQDTLLLYDLENQNRVNRRPLTQLKWLHATQDILFAGRNNFPSKPSPFVETFITLSLGDPSFDLDSFYDNTNDMTVLNDTAYISHNIEKTSAFNTDSLGYLAVYDLNNEAFVEHIDLGNQGAGINEVYNHNGKVYGLAREDSNLVEFNPSTGNVNYHNIGVTQGIGLYNGTLHAIFSGSNVGTYDVQSHTFVNDSVFYATGGSLTLNTAEFDTLSEQYFLAKTDFATVGKGLVYDQNGQFLDSFATNVSPNSIAFHYSTNQLPVASDDYDTLRTGEEATINVTANDNDADGQELTLKSIVSGSNEGTDSIANNAIYYKADINYTGQDTLWYEVCDPVGECDTGMLVLTIEENNAPVANTDYDSVKAGNTIRTAVLSNDTDPDGDSLSLTKIVRNANHGNDSIVEDSIEFQADAAFIGNDSIQYEVCDEYGLCDTGMLKINVWESTSIENGAENQNISTYPNPVEDRLTVQIAGQNGTKEAQVAIQSLQGRTVLTQNLKGNATNLDVAHLEPGVYLLQIETGNTTSIQKIIKQ